MGEDRLHVKNVLLGDVTLQLALEREGNNSSSVKVHFDVLLL
jgi:hypothetical protein